MDPGVPNSWPVLGFFGVFGYQNLLVYGHMWTKRHSDMTLRENTTNRRMTRQKLAFGLVVASLRWKLFSLWNTWGFWVCEKHEILCSRIRLDSVLWQNILLFNSWSSHSHSYDQFILPCFQPEVEVLLMLFFLTPGDFFFKSHEKEMYTVLCQKLRWFPRYVLEKKRFTEIFVPFY
jgi:hypothetical protein